MIKIAILISEAYPYLETKKRLLKLTDEQIHGRGSCGYDCEFMFIWRGKVMETNLTLLDLNS